MLEPALARLQPVVARLWRAAQPRVGQLWATGRPRLLGALAAVDAALSHYRPWQVALLSILLALVAARLLRGARRLVRTVQDKGAWGRRGCWSLALRCTGCWLAMLPVKPGSGQLNTCGPSCLLGAHRAAPAAWQQPNSTPQLCRPASGPAPLAVPTRGAAGWSQVLSGALVDLPGVRQLVRRQQDRLVEKIRADIAAKAARGPGGGALRALPAQGMSPAEVRQRMAYKVGVAAARTRAAGGVGIAARAGASLQGQQRQPAHVRQLSAAALQAGPIASTWLHARRASSPLLRVCGWQLALQVLAR